MPVAGCNEFSHLRVEPWQRRLRRGDRFILFAQPGIAVYGMVLAKAKEGDVMCRTYSALFPEGSEEPLSLTMLDLPLTKKQFGLAKRFGWPSEMPLIRMIVGMIPPGET